MLSSLLAALIFSGALVSCSENTSETGGSESNGAADGTESAAETEAAEETEAYKDDLPENLDFGGESAHFYSREHYRFNDEVTVDDLTGEVINDAIYQRQYKVQDRLNVTIENTKEGDQHGSAEKMKSLVTAGDSTYDIFTSSMYTAAPAAINGIFRNLYDFDYIDTTKPYYTQDYISESKIGKGLYTITGDISLSLIRYSFAMYFNKQLTEDYGIENPYETVREGKWTHDRLQGIVGEIYTDTNGNGERDDGDFYGLGTSNVIIVDAYTSAYDMKMVRINAEGYPELVINAEKAADIIDKIYRLNWESEGVRAFIEISDNNEMPDLCEAFSQNRFIFINNWIYGVETDFLRNMDEDYGIIPYPKYDEAQAGYYTFQHDQIGVFAIPSTSVRAETASAVLEAMSSESSVSLVPAYYDIALKGKYSRDSDSAEMIDIIHNGHKLDAAWIYCTTIGTLAQIPRNMMLAQSRDFASTYKRSEKLYAKTIERLTENFIKLDEKNQ